MQGHLNLFQIQLLDFIQKTNIYDKDGNVILKAGSKITEVKTDKDGKAIIPFSVPVMGEGYGEKDLPINSGDYYFLEENISDSYYISEEPIFVHLEYKTGNTNSNSRSKSC